MIYFLLLVLGALAGGGGKPITGSGVVPRLKRSGKFRQVLISTGADSDLTLSVKALTMPRGGFWDRSIFGRGEVQLDVELIDNATGNVIGSCVVDAESTLGVLWSSSGDRAVNRAVENVAKFVRQT